MPKKRVVSGIQPTGKMHLGNYLGAVKNWPVLQEEYDAFFMVVDLHSLTTMYSDPKQIEANKQDMILDILAAGVDPNKCTVFHQSDVPQHAELHLYLSMITPSGWLTRVPTYKDKQSELKDKKLDTYGFLGYPVLMAADILLYQADVVPVGQDQLPHLELTREIGRRFNHLYGHVFNEPEDKLTQTPLLPGLDGRKMSKSYQNTIPMSDSEEELTKKILKMVTDPNRVRLTDPGDPEKCPVFAYHRLFSASETQNTISSDCKTAKIGCVDCKRTCAAAMNQIFEPIREKRRYYSERPSDVSDILDAGKSRAIEVAKETIGTVQHAMGLN